MITVKQRLTEVAQARQNYLNALADLTEEQGAWKPAPDVWNAVEITEHLFWAEQGGILGMWKTLLGIRAGSVNYEADRPHEGLPVETIIERTWKEKEDVPTVAAPRQGGPLGYWAAALLSLQQQLEAMGAIMADEDLNRMAHPHPISGPMSFGQRLEFLRFHIDRHTGQVERLKASLQAA